MRHSSGVDDDTGLLRCAGSDVGQSPCGLELKNGVGEEGDQPDQIGKIGLFLKDCTSRNSNREEMGGGATIKILN